MKRKLFGLFVTSLVLLSSVTTLASEKDTLIVAQAAEAKTMDPVASNDVPSHRVFLNIYDTLLQRDEKGDLVPALAESWEQVDPLTLVLKLKKGIKFHNGNDFKANDVVFSLTRAKEAPALMSFFGDIDKVEAVDDYTVKITTKQPFGPLVNYLSHKGSCILDEETVNAAGEDYALHPVGTGPYEFVSWRSGDRIVLKANPNYFGGKPVTENLVFRVITEATNRTIALETKEVDIAYEIDPIDLQFVKSNPELVLLEQPALNISYLGFNTQKAPFDKKEVREAIAYAIDVPSLIQAVYLGAATPASSSVPPGVPGYNPNSKKYEQNIALAKELLTKAGYPNGFKAKISLNDTGVRKNIAIILQDQLKQIGIDLEVEIMEWGAYLDKLARGEQDMFILGWTTPPECDSALYALFHSKQHGSGGNRTYYTNTRVDELLDLARRSTNQEERNKYYFEIQDIVQEELPMFVLVNPFDNAGLQKDIKGFQLDMESEHRLYKVGK